MRIKQIGLLLLSVLLFAACEKPEKLPAPSGLQGRQVGKTIVLAWNNVNNASSYEVAKQQNGGRQVWNVYNINFTDYSPDNGLNTYEVRAIGHSNHKSAPSYVNVFYEETSSGGGGGGENTETTLPITKSNIVGYWQYTKRTLSDGTSYTLDDYVNFASNGMWEEVSIESSTCYVTYGTWSLSGSTITVMVVAQNCFVNGVYAYDYPAINRTDIYGVETLTNQKLTYKMGQYPYVSTYEMKRVNSIPASYQHNDDINK